MSECLWVQSIIQITKSLKINDFQQKVGIYINPSEIKMIDNRGFGKFNGECESEEFGLRNPWINNEPVLVQMTIYRTKSLNLSFLHRKRSSKMSVC